MMDERTKKVSHQQPTAYKRLRLRDFGAFQPDITALDTLKTTAYPVIQQFNSVDKQASPAAKFTVLPTPVLVHEEEVAGTGQSTEMAQGSQKSKKKALSLLLRVGGTLLLFALLFRSFSWPSLLLAIGHVRHGMMLISLVVGAAGIILSSYQWRSLLHGERIRYDLADLVNLYVVGIAFSHFLPTGMGGDAIKALHVGRESGNSAGSTSAVLMCRITGFFGMLLVALPVLVFWHSHFSSSFLLTFALLSLLVASIIGGAVASVTVLPKLVAGRWAKSHLHLRQHRFLKRIPLASVARVGTALVEAAKRPRSMSMAMIYGIVFWILAVLNCYAYGLALGINIPLYFYFVVVPLVSLVSFLPISINGYGLRESAFVYTFATMHVLAATALTLALLLDVQALLFGLAGGCIYLTLGKKLNEKKQQYAA